MVDLIRFDSRHWYVCMTNRMHLRSFHSTHNHSWSNIAIRTHTYETKIEWLNPSRFGSVRLVSFPAFVVPHGRSGTDVALSSPKNTHAILHGQKRRACYVMPCHVSFLLCQQKVHEERNRKSKQGKCERMHRPFQYPFVCARCPSRWKELTSCERNPVPHGIHSIASLGTETSQLYVRTH